MKQLPLPSLQIFRQLVDHGPNIATASSKGGFNLTYSEILQESALIAARLGRTVISSPSTSPSTFRPIALLAPQDHTFCLGFMGVLQAGGAVVPIYSRSPQREIEFILRDSGCAQVLLHPQFRSNLTPLLRGSKGLDIAVVDLIPGADLSDLERIAAMRMGKDKTALLGHQNIEIVEWIESSENADAMVVYTSGTTGRPKGVVKTHAQLAEMCKGVVKAWNYAPTDRVLEFLPLHHLHGLLNKCLAVLWAGGVVEFLGSANANAIWDRLADPTKPMLSMFHAVPTIYALMLEELESGRMDEASQKRALQHLRQMRLIVSGSAALPQCRFSKWEALTGHRILERYGTTEAGMILGNPLTPVSTRFPGHVGAPFPGMDVRLVDPETEADVTREPGKQGEVRVRSEHGLFSRYHNRSEVTRKAFDEDNWYKTGDLGKYDPEKGFKIVGRLSADILNSGGYKISALEIEAAIQEHEQVAEVVVLGRCHSKWGDEVVAVVRIKETAMRSANVSGNPLEKRTALLTTEGLHDFLASRLASHMLPRTMYIVNSIPKNAMGKVDKRVLLEQLGK
jgi:malonyl-CoA/methylmalonyl-CoA synthetase